MCRKSRRDPDLWHGNCLNELWCSILYQISHEAARAALFSQDKELDDDALCCCRSSFWKKINIFILSHRRSLICGDIQTSSSANLWKLRYSHAVIRNYRRWYQNWWLLLCRILVISCTTWLRILQFGRFLILKDVLHFSVILYQEVPIVRNYENAIHIFLKGSFICKHLRVQINSNSSYFNTKLRVFFILKLEKWEAL